MLREHDTSRTNPVAPAFIITTGRNALELGYHVVLQGIPHTDRYANVLHQLIVNPLESWRAPLCGLRLQGSCLDRS
jgi:hypothetical protein